MDFERKKSVEWYDPKQLANTGIKAVISGIFGNFNDKREILAALFQDSDKDPIDYSQYKDEIWIDYISDTGDGFDATFSMASLLAKYELEADGHKIPRAKLLIMGGDQVYPTATRQEYKNRLQGPYETALPTDPSDPDGKNAPHLFAIPGNHDWYDGLATFIKVFCQKRSIGNWRTVQTRSYFALKLPGDVWLFGIDVQLSSDVDFNQIQYFEKILEKKVTDGSRIILCTAEPAWVYATSKKPDSYNNLKHFEKNILGANSKFKDRDIRTILTISGDLHHYSRYTNEESEAPTNERITAGGGGAFLHPTHNLPNEIPGLYGGDFKLKKRFPSYSDSKSLIWKNLLFPFMNSGMGITLGIIYAFTTWIFFTRQSISAQASFGDIFTGIFQSPGMVFLMALLTIGLTVFVNNTPYNPKYSKGFYSLFGFIHGLFHAAMILVCIYLVQLLFNALDSSPFIEILLSALGVLAFGFIVGGLAFGLYLIFCNRFLGNHDNEAYSSLKWEGYKNFLRIHISISAITIYPIGVKKVARWKPDGKDAKPPFTTHEPIEYKLIEEPIKIQI